MDYSNMSDFEINRMVGDAVFKGLWSCRPGTAGNNSDSWYYGNADASFNPLSPLPDYVNDAAAAWPIIQGNLLRVAPVSFPEKVHWVVSRDIHSNHDTNPLRAAMIVFLMMQEPANVPANPAGPDIR